MKKVRIGSVGLGRLGAEHAKNIASYVEGAELVALCDVDTAKLAEMAADLGVPNTYSDFEEMCKNPDIDAVAIISPSFLHVSQIEIAMKYGKHVFCEKPLGVDVPACKAAEEIVNSHPELVFQIGFMRHFDKSYQEAKMRVERGDIGKVVLVRSYTQDSRSSIEATLKFAPHSGGQFLDMCVHDLDLIRWFTESEIKEVWAIGDVFEFDLYHELKDADNAAVALTCKNGTMGFIFANRTHAAGSNVETEIIGTHGTLRVANVGSRNLLEIVDEHGARREYFNDFMFRWHDAFVSELTAFVGHINAGTKPRSLMVEDGTAATVAAYRCKESYETGDKLLVE